MQCDKSCHFDDFFEKSRKKNLAFLRGPFFVVLFLYSFILEPFSRLRSRG